MTAEYTIRRFGPYTAESLSGDSFIVRDLPFVRADGEPLMLYIDCAEGAFVVSDDGEALCGIGAPGKLHLREITASEGVRLDHQTMSVRCASEREIAGCITRLIHVLTGSGIYFPLPVNIRKAAARR